MAEPLSTLIVDDLLETFLEVTPSNGYERSIKTAKRTETPPDVAELDAIFFFELSERYEDGVTGCEDNTMAVTLQGWFHIEDDLSRSADKLAADIRKVVRVDRTRGQRAFNSQVIERTPGFETEYDSIGSLFVIVEIKYRTQWGDPYSLP